MTATPAGAGGRQRYVERARAGMREAILDAVEHLVRDRGWAATRVADVADRAGVSRQSVYQLFGSREGLAQEYVMREADRFLLLVVEAVRGRADDPLAAIEAALGVFLSGAADNVMVKALLSGHDSDGLLPLVTTHGMPIIEAATDRLREAIDDLWPNLHHADVSLFTESVVRLAISHATTPSADPRQAAKNITHLLRPFVIEAFPR